MIIRVFLAVCLTVRLFFSPIAEAKVECKVIGPAKPVTAKEKKDVVLQCRVEPERDVTKETVEWKLGDKMVHRYRSRKDDLDFQDSQFKDRTSFFRQEMIHGNISLKLTNISQDDAGTYTCKVLKLQGQVTLNVDKVDHGHQKKDLKISLSTVAIIIFAFTVAVTVAVAFTVTVAFAAGGFLLWKCRAKNDTAGQDRAKNDTAGPRQEHEGTPLPVPGSDAEPRGSPLRHRSAAVPRNDIYRNYQ